jgi:radical SAM protein with 4Fe4S-binding SPASM domain
MTINVKPYPTTTLFNIKEVDIIGNTKTGSVVGLTDKGVLLVKKILKGEPIILEELSAEDTTLLKTLIKYDILYDGSIDKVAVEEKKEIDSAYLHVTDACNLHCIGCYSENAFRSKPQDLSLDAMKHILDQLGSYSLKNLIISGGEPFLRNDLDEIVKYAKEKAGVENIIIITNGTVIRENILYKLKPYIYSISVSVDGFDEKHPTYLRDPGIFNRVLQSVKLIKSVGISVSILPTLHQKNIYFIQEYLKMARELGVGISFSILTCNFDNLNECKDFIPGEDELVYLGKYMSGELDTGDVSIENISIEDMSLGVKVKCEAGEKLISIAANGDVYPCHMLHYEKLRFGNILNQSLKEILNSPMATYFRNLKVDNFERCKDCEYKYLCGGGCRAHAFYNSGTLYAHDNYCSLYKEYYGAVASKFKSLKESKEKAV